MSLAVHKASIVDYFGSEGLELLTSIERKTEGSQLSYDPHSKEFTVLNTVNIPGTNLKHLLQRSGRMVFFLLRATVLSGCLL